jgi:hypothetical protein
MPCTLHDVRNIHIYLRQRSDGGEVGQNIRKNAKKDNNLLTWNGYVRVRTRLNAIHEPPHSKQVGSLT